MNRHFIISAITPLAAPLVALLGAAWRATGRLRLRNGGRRALQVLLLLACLVLSGCQTQLYSGLQEKEANAVLAALLDASIEAEKKPSEEGTYAIFVDKAEFARAMAVLEAQALPGRHYDDLGTVFGKMAMFSTPTEEKARYLYAIQEELSQTIAAIDGVLMARVHLVLPEQDILGRDSQKPSAAVLVKHVDDIRHDPVAYQREIRRLVAASVSNMEEEQIVVTFSPAAPREVAPRSAQWRSVFGIRVPEESARALWVVLAAAAVLCLALLGAALFFALRLRRRKAEES